MMQRNIKHIKSENFMYNNKQNFENLIRCPFECNTFAAKENLKNHIQYDCLKGKIFKNLFYLCLCGKTPNLFKKEEKYHCKECHNNNQLQIQKMKAEDNYLNEQFSALSQLIKLNKEKEKNLLKRNSTYAQNSNNNSNNNNNNNLKNKNLKNEINFLQNQEIKEPQVNSFNNQGQSLKHNLEDLEKTLNLNNSKNQDEGFSMNEISLINLFGNELKFNKKSEKEAASEANASAAKAELANHLNLNLKEGLPFIKEDSEENQNFLSDNELSKKQSKGKDKSSSNMTAVAENENLNVNNPPPEESASKTHSINEDEIFLNAKEILMRKTIDSSKKDESGSSLNGGKGNSKTFSSNPDFIEAVNKQEADYFEIIYLNRVEKSVSNFDKIDDIIFNSNLINKNKMNENDSKLTKSKKEVEPIEEIGEDDDFEDLFINIKKKKEKKKKPAASEKIQMKKQIKQEEPSSKSEEMLIGNINISKKAKEDVKEKSKKAKNKSNDESILNNKKFNNSNNESIYDQDETMINNSVESDSDSNMRSKRQNYDLNGTMMQPKKTMVNNSKNKNLNQILIEQSFVNTELEESMMQDNSTKEKSSYSNESRTNRNQRMKQVSYKSSANLNDSMISTHEVLYNQNNSSKRNYIGNALDSSMISVNDFKSNSQNDESFLAPRIQKSISNTKAYIQSNSDRQFHFQRQQQQKNFAKNANSKLNDSMMDGLEQEENQSMNYQNYYSLRNNHSNNCDNSMIAYPSSQKQKRIVSYDYYSNLADNSISSIKNKMQKAKKYEHHKKIQEQDEDEFSEEDLNKNFYSNSNTRNNQAYYNQINHNKNYINNNYKSNSGQFRNNNLNDTMCGDYDQGKYFYEEVRFAKPQRFQFNFAENEKQFALENRANKNQNKNKKVAKIIPEISLDDSCLNNSLFTNNLKSSSKMQKEEGNSSLNNKKAKGIQDSFKKNFTEDDDDKNQNKKSSRNQANKSGKKHKENKSESKSKQEEEDFEEYFRNCKKKNNQNVSESSNKNFNENNERENSQKGDFKEIRAVKEKESIENGNQKVIESDNEEENHNLSNGVLSSARRNEVN